MFQLLIPVWQRFALNSMVSGDYDKAEKYFLRIHRYKPLLSGFEYNLGLIKLAQNKYEEAELFLKKDISLYGESYNRLRVMGDLYYIWGKRELASMLYKKAFAVCEGEFDKNILNIRIQKCSSEKAFDKVKKGHILYKEGNYLLKSGKNAEALKAFSDAVEQDGTHFQALNNKGTILMNTFHKYKEALECFEQASKLTNLPVIHSNVLKARESLKKNSDGNIQETV